jgi:uncharacterized membrane protein YedE/YeeE
MKGARYLLFGIIFGITLCKVEAVSWWRMQEMFHFAAFKMYGLFMAAIITGTLSVWIIRKFHIKTLDGKDIVIPVKKFNWGYVWGGLIFGLGWALTGACPGPLLATIGAGNTVAIVIFLSAIGGTWVYSYFRARLPH